MPCMPMPRMKIDTLNLGSVNSSKVETTEYIKQKVNIQSFNPFVKHFAHREHERSRAILA